LTIWVGNVQASNSDALKKEFNALDGVKHTLVRAVSLALIAAFVYISALVCARR
jgi:hypothetical protein